VVDVNATTSTTELIAMTTGTTPAATPTTSTTPTTATTTGAAARAWPLPARLGVAGIAAFFGASFVAGAFKPGYSHLREAVSALAATDSPAAPLMITAFLVSAVGMTATGVGIWRRLSVGVAGRVAAGLVVLSGLMMVVAGLARQDCSERLPSCIDHGEAPLGTTHFWVHQYVSLGLFVLLTISMFVMARGLRRSAGWAQLARWSKVAGLFSLLCIAELMVDPPALDPYAGLVQRVFVLVLFGWPVFVAGAPARIPGGGAERDAASVEDPAVPRRRARDAVFSERSALTPTWRGWVEPIRPGHLR
jgi:hypothetical membrane protein